MNLRTISFSIATSAAVLLPAAALAETLAFRAPASKVEFTGKKVVGKHDGGFNQFTGKIDLGPGAKIEGGKVSVEIDMASVYTDTDKLTAHLRSPDFFDVAKYPKARFVSNRIAKKGDVYEITGELDFHGVKKTLTFPARIAVTPAAVSADAEFQFNRKDFGVTYPGMPDNLISDMVTMRLAVQAPRSPRQDVN
jgi:polyisoprenoid-binding protein YceI